GYEETFAEAMTFLWRGWPAKVAVGAGAPRVRDIILPGESWKKLSPGYTGMRSAVFNSAGEVFFCAQGRIVKIGSDGHVAGPRAFGKRPVTALAVGSDDALYTLDDRGRINVYDTTGRPAVFARRVHGDQMIARP